jgi:hypothetical protein
MPFSFTLERKEETIPLRAGRTGGRNPAPRGTTYGGFEVLVDA